MAAPEDLVELAETLSAKTGQSEARIANLSGRAGNFFSRLRNGRDCSVGTYNSMLQRFSNTWPIDLDWPIAIERPAPADAPERAA